MATNTGKMDLKATEKTLHRLKLRFARGELTSKQFQEFADQTLVSLGESFAPHAALIKMVSEELSWLRHVDTTKLDSTPSVKPAMTLRQFEAFLKRKEKEGKKWTITYGSDSSKGSASICQRSLPPGINHLFCARDAVVPLDTDSVFVDLGSGFGLVVAQIALTTSVGRAVGVEFATSHALVAQEVSKAVKSELGLDKKKRIALLHDNLIKPMKEATRYYLAEGTVFYITNLKMQDPLIEKAGYASSVEVGIRNKLAELISQLTDETARNRTRILVATDPLLDVPKVKGDVGPFSLDKKWKLNCRFKDRISFRPGELKEWSEKHEREQYAYVYEFGTQIEKDLTVDTPRRSSRHVKQKHPRDDHSEGSSSSLQTTTPMLSAKKSKQREAELLERELFEEGNFAEDEAIWRQSIHRQLFQQSLKQDIQLIYMNTELYQRNHFIWTQRLLQLMDMAQKYERPQDSTPQVLAFIPKELQNEMTEAENTWESTRIRPGGEILKKFETRVITPEDFAVFLSRTKRASRIFIIESPFDAEMFFNVIRWNPNDLIQALARQRILILIDQEEVLRETTALNKAIKEWERATAIKSAPVFDEFDDPYNIAKWAEGFEIFARAQTQRYHYDTQYFVLRSKKLVEEVKQKTDEIEKLQKLLDRPGNQGGFAADDAQKRKDKLRADLTTKYQKE